ncbi:hypothetical protein [Pedobacter sp. KACC 23697]|uniref:Uncharacterized protein n=1 Tax=Pedobacter sp. KACC 23697 TaxID=3149230 RepID=A0AAU7K656_9SPHI
MQRYKPPSNWYADYSKDGEFFGEMAAPITEKNFQEYKSIHGEEKAAGYLQAIKDFQAEFVAIRYRGTPPRVRNYLDKLIEHNAEFLKGFNSVSDASSKDKPRI